MSGASAGTLAQAGGARDAAPPRVLLGPCLHLGMGEESLIATLNAWGAARDLEAADARADLLATQAVVATTFDHAQATVVSIVEAFRLEAETIRGQAYHEAQASVARLEHVVGEARARFGEQDARFGAGLGELAQRLQAADA